MNKKVWKKVLWSVVVLAKVLVVVMIFGGARTDEPTDVVDKKIACEIVAIPSTVSFAGEKMPLERFDVNESLDRELLSNAYFHSQTIRIIKMAPRYFSIIEPILKEKGIPDDFKYLAVAESGLNPIAVSPAKAVGFWQFLKGTAMDYGLEVNEQVDERYHIEKATRAACDYIKDAHDKFGTWTMVAAAYNRGMNGVSKQMERQKETNYYDLLLTTETARYVYRIVALKLIMEHPEAYGFEIKDSEKYPLIPLKEVEISGEIKDFAEFAEKQGTNYKLLKYFNPWLRDNFLSNPRNKKYTVKIPVLD